MALEATSDHARVDIAAEAQLQPKAAAAGPGPARSDDLAADGVADVDDVAEAVGPPRAQQHEQLGVGRAGLGLGEVQGDAERRARAVSRAVEGGLQGLDAAARGVAAQVDADDAAGAEPRGERDGLGGLGGGVAAVDGEDETRVHAGAGGGALVVGDGGQDGVDVVGLGKGGAGQGARGGAQLEVDDAVGGEGPEDGEGGVPEGGEVVDEVVDVGREEGEEAGHGRDVGEQARLAGLRCLGMGSLGWWFGKAETILLLVLPIHYWRGPCRTRGPRPRQAERRERERNLRLEVIIMFSLGHLDQRICQVRFAGLLFREPDFMEALPADAPAQVSVELRDDKKRWLATTWFWTSRINSPCPALKRHLSLEIILLTSILGSATQSMSVSMSMKTYMPSLQFPNGMLGLVKEQPSQLPINS